DELHHVEARDADLDHSAGNAGDGDAIPHAHTVTANDEEVGGNREQDGLQAYGNARGDESGEGGERAELRDEAEDDDEAAEKADDHAPYHQKLATAAQIGNVTHRGAAPRLANDSQKQQSTGDEGEADQQRAQDRLVFGIDCDAPAGKRAALLIEKHHLLAEWKHRVGEHAEGCRQLVKLFPRSEDVLRIGGRGGFEVHVLLAQSVALLDQAAQHVSERLAQAVGLGTQVIGFGNLLIDGPAGRQKIEQHG